MNVEITGAKILLELPFGITITETQVNMWIIMAFIAWLCFWLTRNLNVKPTGKKQIVAEYLVKMCNNLVIENMGAAFKNFAPFIGTLFSFAVFCSLSSLLGMFPPTSDLNTTLGWAIVVFFMVMYYKFKTNGFVGYFKGLTEPFAVMTPFNILGEFASPVSMSFRMFGNTASGGVISALLYAALAGLSSLLLGWLPGAISGVPILQIGIPAVLSIYFDLFSSLIQAYIFCMLTMLYVKSAAGVD